MNFSQSQVKQKSSSSKKVDLADDNLNEFFGLSQEKNNQENVDVAPNGPPKKSEGAELKDEPKSSSYENVHRSPQGSGCEGLPETSSKLKGSPQWVKKLKSEDLSSSSSLSSDSQSSDEEKDNCREKTRALPPSKKKYRSRFPPHLRRRYCKI